MTAPVGIVVQSAQQYSVARYSMETGVAVARNSGQQQRFVDQKVCRPMPVAISRVAGQRLLGSATIVVGTSQVRGLGLVPAYSSGARREVQTVVLGLEREIL